MFARAWFLLAIAALAGGQTRAFADAIPDQSGPSSPITYDFTGTLNQPINGSTSFSGTFSYDNGLTPGNLGTDITALGPLSAYPLYALPAATLSLGGQTFAVTSPTTMLPGPEPYVSAITNPQIMFTFQGGKYGDPLGLYLDAGLAEPNNGSQGFLLRAVGLESALGLYASMKINLLNSAGGLWPMNINATSLPRLRLPDFNINQIQLLVNQLAGPPVSATGYLTSLEPESSIPEPSTIAIFTVLGACSLIYHQGFHNKGISQQVHNKSSQQGQAW